MVHCGMKRIVSLAAKAFLTATIFTGCSTTGSSDFWQGAALSFAAGVQAGQDVATQQQVLRQQQVARQQQVVRTQGIFMSTPNGPVVGSVDSNGGIFMSTPNGPVVGSIR
jgi:hypothetical protein